MNHLQNPPHIDSDSPITFKLKTSIYNLAFSHGHWGLRKVEDGKPLDKTELTNKNDEAIFSYLAGAERCTEQEARSAYERGQEIS